MPITTPIASKLLVVIAGPTAVGKTELAVKLAEHFNSEILSADSRQFYAELNIGTAKPDASQLKRVKHHFINTKSVRELYGAGHYAKDGLHLLEDLFKKHKVLFLVGGSGLYIKALIEGVDDFEDIPAEIRENLNSEFKMRGTGWLQEELLKMDPEYYGKVDRNNPQRLIRALEVIRYSGKTFSSFLNKHQKERSFNTLKLLINCPRETLYQRINSRVDIMMQDGLLEEVKALREFKFFNALKTVGYRELNDFLEGKNNLETAVSLIKQHSRNYAKRQITWFRNQDNYTEYTPEQFNEISSLIDFSLKNQNTKK